MCRVSTTRFTFKSSALLQCRKGSILSGEEAVGERPWGAVTRRT